MKTELKDFMSTCSGGTIYDYNNRRDEAKKQFTTEDINSLDVSGYVVELMDKS